LNKCRNKGFKKGWILNKCDNSIKDSISENLFIDRKINDCTNTHKASDFYNM